MNPKKERKEVTKMALMTGEQYIESIKKIKMEIYMFGEKYSNPTERIMKERKLFFSCKSF